ncbi:MAG TPA: hypothetical protein VJ934_08770 [Desulfomicrobiaceae bacterium]|nr:hypothetical protein [Desulfomicrobiaceae bacterium]
MRYLYCILIFIVFFSALPALAHEETLSLVNNGKAIELSVDSLRAEADLEFTLFAPFRGQDVRIRGLLLESFFEKHLSRVPERIRLVAGDGYELPFENWKPNHWVLVTHEDGVPLTLRTQGPIRLVERNYAGRDPKILRNFNDWIWMLKRIEVLP